ncbi:pentapeptide repeat-containing protein [Legionella oakridgensis]|nr:pentapeptide repeat-containing protein [Legionella oakridgensis]
MVTLTMGLCTLAALLFQLLDIPFIQKIVFSPAFFYIMPPFFFGIAMTILHQYEQILTKLRNILLAFCKFLYPIFVVICLAFLLAIPFANRAFADFWPVIVVLSAFNILLFNGIFQAGLDKEPYVHWFCYLIYACFILSALYSLFVLKYPWLEMWNYGMTPLALLLLIALIIHALYNVSYSLAIFFSQKPWLSMIKPVNTMLALFIAVVYLILALPWFHIGKIAAHNQLARLLNNKPIINPQNPNLNQGYLVGANLQGANLQGRDLRNIDFSHANLQGANLSSANLEHANLQAANLSHSNLNKANLTRTQLSYADLSQANLSNTELNRAWLNQAILNGTNLTNADLQQAFGLQQKTLIRLAVQTSNYRKI